MKERDIKKAVREGYAKIARRGSKSCCEVKSCCDATDTAKTYSKNIGYADEDVGSAPDGSDLGLGCGNPVALASLKKGETVLDLGSGAGFDCFLAANKVGKKGKIIGVDMTPEMIDKARENAHKGNYENVEFRLGEIEYLPAADNSVDAIISNCVINLSIDKKQVFREAFRVLKPGGRFMVSDIVLLKKLPDSIRNSLRAYVGCLSGALLKEEYIKTITDAGFKEVKIVQEKSFPVDLMLNDETTQILIKNAHISVERIKKVSDSVLSVSVQGVKPKK
jgi:arsenite methyltransferase